MSVFQNHGLGTCSAVLNEVAQGPWESVLKGLHELKRTGWLNRGIPKESAESVLEHSLKVRNAALIYAKARGDLNLSRIEFMAAVHDVAESNRMVGDIAPSAGISRAEKYARELAALRVLATELGAVGGELLSVWLEFEEGASPEAIAVKQLDRMDALVQAVIYARLGYPTRGFYDDTKRKVTDPILLKIVEEIIAAENSAVEPYDLYFRLLQSAPGLSMQP